MRIFLLVIIILMGAYSVSAQDFDLIFTSSESGNQTHQARNTITFGPGYSYTPSGGTMTADIVDPVVSGDVSYQAVVDPGSRSLNTSYLVGTTNGSFNVDAVGGATYSIPIELPPGVAGLQPQLSLNYSSLGNSGIAGYGWNIGGISVITRSPQTYYHDDTYAGVDITSSDRFSLDGQRLVCTYGSYGGNNSQYRTENDIFTKVTCTTTGIGPSQFQAKTKSGHTYQYGYNSDADHTIVGYDTIVSWCVNKITDVYGNEMDFSYIKDNNNIYPAEITYGPNTITFFYKERSDDKHSYIKGYEIRHRLILTKIEVEYNNNLIKKYELKYNYPTSNYNRYSILNEVVEYGIGGSRLNSTAFSYQTPDIVDFEQTEYNPSHNYISYKSRLTTGDFNGDGITDVFAIDDPDIDGSYNGWKLNLNDGDDSFSTYSGDFSIDETKIVEMSAMDLNGDGKDDLVISQAYDLIIPYNGWKIPYVLFYYALSTGTSMSDAEFIVYKVDAKVFYDPLLSPSNRTGDFDGDGLEDCCIINGSGLCDIYSFEVSGGQIGDFELKYTQDLGSFDDDDFIYVSDFDGDGKTDIWVTNENGLKIYSLINTSFSEVYSHYFPNNEYHFRLGDYNADGKTDIFAYGSTGDWSDWQMRLSTGTEFEINYIPKKKNNLKDDIVRIGDFNGDGYTDLMVMAEDDAWSGHYYYISKDHGTDFYSHFLSGAYAQVSTHNYFVEDLNGDGRDDYLCTDGEAAWSNGYMIYKSGYKNKIMLEKVANGLNHHTEISYGYLSQADTTVYKKDSTALFPVYDYQGALPIVDTVWTDNGRGSQNLTTYYHKGAKIHRQGKGFLCYEENKVKDVANDAVTETKFSYDTTYFYPELLSVKQYADGDSIQTVYNSWDEDETASGIYEIDPIFPYITESVKNNILKDQSVSSSYDYDSYGNLLKEIVDYDNGVTDTVTNTYTNDGANWLLGKLSSSRTSSYKSGEAAISNTISYTYYTDGILKPDFIRFYEGTGLYYYKNHDYDAYGNLTQLFEYGTGVGSRTTNYTYDDTNHIRMETVDDPLDHTTTYSYDTYGRLSSGEDYLSNSISFTYDNLGRVLTETQPDGFVTTTTYGWGIGDFDNSCYYIQHSGNDGLVSKTWHDKLSREIRNDFKGFDGSNIYTVSDYNTQGQVYRVSEPSISTSPSQWNTNTWDSYGRIDYIDRPSGMDTDYEYDDNRITETTGGKTSWKETDSQGLLTQAYDNGGTIVYAYYPDGKIKTITAPGSVVTTMEYNDAARNQTKLIDPSAGTIEYTYNSFGQLKTQENARSQTTTYNYHADGRLNTKVTPEGTTTYSYNGNDQLSGISSPGSVSIAFTYDHIGRDSIFTETISDSTFSTIFTYDNLGRLSTRTHPSGIAETYNYNNSGYFYSISAGGSTRYTITDMNQRLQITDATYGGNLSGDFGFDSYGYPTYSKASYGGYKQDYRYSFNTSTGNLNSRQNYLRSLSESFSYDNLNRLTGVSGPENLTMGYASNGNILTKSDVGTDAFDYDHATKPYVLTNVETSSGLIPNEEQSIGYTSFEQVSTIEEGDYYAVFTYNSNGQRCKMEVEEDSNPILTRWYAGSRYIKENEGGTVREYTWIGGDAYSATTLAVKQGENTTWYYLLRDYLGNITHVTNSAGSVVYEYNFDAWGRRRDTTNWDYTLSYESELIAGRGFTSHEYLPWFDLYNMNGRLYDPVVGRFLSADPIVQDPSLTQSLNRYSYCLNNPLRYTDPSGYRHNVIKQPNNEAPSNGGFSPTSAAYWDPAPHNLIGSPGWGENGSGYGGIYYDWYSGTYRSTYPGNYPVSWEYAYSVMSPYGIPLPPNTDLGSISYGTRNGVSGVWYQTVDVSSQTRFGAIGSTPFAATFSVDLIKSFAAFNAANSGDAFTGYKGKRYYFEGVRVRELNFGNFKHGAAMSMPGVGIFVGPGGINDVDLLKHEFGHILQARKWGAKVFYGDVAPASLRYANYANGDPYYSNLDYMSNWTEWSANYLSYKYFNGNFNTTNYPISPVNSGKHIFHFPHSVNTPSEFYFNWLGD